MKNDRFRGFIGKFYIDLWHFYLAFINKKFNLSNYSLSISGIYGCNIGLLSSSSSIYCFFTKDLYLNKKLKLFVNLIILLNV